MYGEAVFDRRDEVRDASEGGPTELADGQIAEEAFDPVQPRRRCGCEVHMETRMGCEPLPHFRVLVSRVIVADQMQGFFPWVFRG